MRIYVAGPYTGADQPAIDENVRVAIDTGLALLKRGHAPFIPHLTGFVDLRAQQIGMNVTWGEYVRWDLEWLRVCDALFYLGSSPGADLELEEAQQLGKTIYRNLEDVPDVSKQDST